jgi:hypothetical protein
VTESQLPSRCDVKGTAESTDHIKFRELLRLKDNAPLALDPLKSALIVVGVQRWFTQPEQPLWQFNEKLVSGCQPDTSGGFRAEFWATYNTCSGCSGPSVCR